MDTREFLKNHFSQYENDDLCKKYENNIPLSELQGDDFELITDSQEIAELCRYFVGVISPDNITGAVVSIDEYEADYSEVYVTESNRPFDLNAIYHPLSYYL